MSRSLHLLIIANSSESDTQSWVGEYSSEEMLISLVISRSDLACYLIDALLHVASPKTWLKEVHI